MDLLRLLTLAVLLAHASKWDRTPGHTVFQHEDVYAQLHQIMRNIFNACANAGEKYYDNKNALVQGANIAGFERVAQAMMEQGLV